MGRWGDGGGLAYKGRFFTKRLVSMALPIKVFEIDRILQASAIFLWSFYCLDAKREWWFPPRPTDSRLPTPDSRLPTPDWVTLM